MNATPSPFESSDHNYVSDPTDVEDADYLTAEEDLVDDPRYYVSQQHGQEGYDNEPSNFASDFNGFTDTAEMQGAAKEGTGHIYTDSSNFRIIRLQRQLRYDGRAPC